MIERAHDLPLATQARLLGIARSTVYCEPAPVSTTYLAMMRRIDELHLDYPFAGGRMLRSMLVNERKTVGRTHVRMPMPRMVIEALYRRPRTSKPAPGHKIYPYLLRDFAVTRPNQVWVADITYIPMALRFVYLVVVLDWFTRRALSWRVSITLEADFCI
jgi:putative transposase